MCPLCLEKKHTHNLTRGLSTQRWTLSKKVDWAGRLPFIQTTEWKAKLKRETWNKLNMQQQHQFKGTSFHLNTGYRLFPQCPENMVTPQARWFDKWVFFWLASETSSTAGAAFIHPTEKHKQTSINNPRLSGPPSSIHSVYYPNRIPLLLISATNHTLISAATSCTTMVLVIYAWWAGILCT